MDTIRIDEILLTGIDYEDIPCYFLHSESVNNQPKAKVKIQINETSVNLWLSANDTYDWAHAPGSSWPCSRLSGNRLFAAFDSNGLCDLSINGGRGNQDIDSNEFNAIASDFLRNRGHLPKEHPCFFVTIGQFA